MDKTSEVVTVVCGAASADTCLAEEADDFDARSVKQNRQTIQKQEKNRDNSLCCI